MKLILFLLSIFIHRIWFAPISYFMAFEILLTTWWIIKSHTSSFKIKLKMWANEAPLFPWIYLKIKCVCLLWSLKKLKVAKKMKNKNEI